MEYEPLAKKEAYKLIEGLVNKFDEHLDAYLDTNYNETKARSDPHL